ncbi:MAG: putative toxin-antitoxin system toxin component, PIN family [Gemmatimonadales bacterium]
MRVCLDTNVLVAALATRGLAADVLRLILAEHDLLVPEVVLTELQRVLAKKLKLPSTQIDAFEAFLREHEVLPKPAGLLDLAIRDRADAWVVASAVAGRADVLVTGDQDLLVLGPRAPLPVLDPRGFWNLVRGSADEP